MSKSRLEKFLYALYSLDSSDLPNPLSRIEELYNCLVTGTDVPTFKPLSRVEKYLMAILGGYDVDSLPNPLSRVEVLLYKLAMGDDNLDDFKSFLSEHEELLAEIIRNGGVGGNIDIEYVLCTLSTGFNTLYNTVEKPFKSAILKGNTLDSLVDFKDSFSVNNNVIDFDFLFKNKIDLAYTLVINITEATSRLGASDYIQVRGVREDNTVVNIKRLTQEFAVGTYSIDFTFNEVFSRFRLAVSFNCVANAKLKGELYSVKMPVLRTVGKNLFYGEIERGSYHSTATTKIDSDKTRCRSSIVPLIPDGFKGRATISKGFQFYLRLFKDGKVVKESGFSTFYTLDNTSNTFSEVTIVIRKVDNTEITDDELATIKIQIEEGSVGTEYEPFKSNILTVNEEVELRGIGKVKDELNLLTGEVIKKFSEVTLDGIDDNITYTAYNTNNEGYSVFRCKISESIYGTRKYIGEWISTFPKGSQNSSDLKNKEYVGGHWYGATNLPNMFVVKLLTSSMSSDDIDGFKEYLQHNPITVQYELATESVKTVDLSVADQDENDTELSTFNDITHVTLSSEGLIPKAELEVATKNKEVLSTLSLEMDDISTTQNALQETSNTQSENVDATMMATTEIYEGLL